MFDPSLLGTATADPETMSGFRGIVQAIVEETNRFDGPVYTINGDSHVYAENQPLAEGSPWLAVYGQGTAADHLQRYYGGRIRQRHQLREVQRRGEQRTGRRSPVLGEGALQRVTAAGRGRPGGATRRRPLALGNESRNLNVQAVMDFGIFTFGELTRSDTGMPLTRAAAQGDH